MGIEKGNILVSGKLCVCGKCGKIITSGSNYALLLHSSGVEESVCMECLDVLNELAELISKYTSGVNKKGIQDNIELSKVYKRIRDCIEYYYLRTGIYLDALDCLRDV